MNHAFNPDWQGDGGKICRDCAMFESHHWHDMRLTTLQIEQPVPAPTPKVRGLYWNTKNVKHDAKILLVVGIFVGLIVLVSLIIVFPHFFLLCLFFGCFMALIAPPSASEIAAAIRREGRY